MGQGMAACKPGGSSCARESGQAGQELHLVEQQPRQELRQSAVSHIVGNRIDHS